MPGYILAKTRRHPTTKVCLPCISNSRDMPNFLAPTPSRGGSGARSLSLCSFFSCPPESLWHRGPDTSKKSENCLPQPLPQSLQKVSKSLETGKSLARSAKLRLFPDSREVALDGPNRQSPIASVQRTRSTLADHSAIPHGTNVAPMNANRAIPITAQ